VKRAERAKDIIGVETESDRLNNGTQGRRKAQTNANIQTRQVDKFPNTRQQCASINLTLITLTATTATTATPTMSRNIRPGAGAFPSRPTRSRQNDDYSHMSDPGGGGNYGKAGRNDYSRHGGDDVGHYSQSQRPYGAGSNGRRDDGGNPDRSGFSRSNNNTLSTGSTASTTSSSGSSLLGRMKVRSADTSARTSIDDDSERTPVRGGSWARKPPAVRENRQREEELGTAIHHEPPAANTG